MLTVVCRLYFYSAVRSRRVAEYCDERVCLSVCLSVRTSIGYFAKLSMHATQAVAMARFSRNADGVRCDALCTSRRFHNMFDIVFTHNRRGKGYCSTLLAGWQRGFHTVAYAQTDSLRSAPSESDMSLRRSLKRGRSLLSTVASLC